VRIWLLKSNIGVSGMSAAKTARPKVGRCSFNSSNSRYYKRLELSKLNYDRLLIILLHCCFNSAFNLKVRRYSKGDKGVMASIRNVSGAAASMAKSLRATSESIGNRLPRLSNSKLVLVNDLSPTKATPGPGIAGAALARANSLKSDGAGAALRTSINGKMMGKGWLRDAPAEVLKRLEASYSAAELDAARERQGRNTPSLLTPT